MLTSTITHRLTNAVGTTILSYEFIWTHANGVLGGDRIEVAVDNSEQKVCTSKSWDGCEWLCDGYDWVYHQRANYVYRLWRTLTNQPALRVHNTPMAISSAKALQDAYAENPLKGNNQHFGSFLGYSYAYWSPSADSTVNTAYPAYQFFFGSNTVVIVDALSGQVRQATTAY